MIKNPELLIEEIKTKGEERAENVAKMKASDYSRKVIIAEIMNKIEKESITEPLKYDQRGKPLTEAKLDRLARGTKEYKDYIGEHETIVKNALQAESDYDTLLATKTFLNGRNSLNIAKINKDLDYQG